MPSFSPLPHTPITHHGRSLIPLLPVNTWTWATHAYMDVLSTSNNSWSHETLVHTLCFTIFFWLSSTEALKPACHQKSLLGGQKKERARKQFILKHMGRVMARNSQVARIFTPSHYDLALINHLMYLYILKYFQNGFHDSLIKSNGSGGGPHPPAPKLPEGSPTTHLPALLAPPATLSLMAKKPGGAARDRKTFFLPATSHNPGAC